MKNSELRTRAKELLQECGIIRRMLVKSINTPKKTPTSYNAPNTRKARCNIMSCITDICKLDFQSNKFINVFFGYEPCGVRMFAHGIREAYTDDKSNTPNFVDRLILSASSEICLNALFHWGTLSGDYAEARNSVFGDVAYFDYQDTVDLMNQIVEEVKNGAIPLVWYGHNAQDLCGLMALLYKLKDTDCTIIELELSGEVFDWKGNVRKNRRYWEMLRPEEVRPFVAKAKILTEEKRQALLVCWEKLCQENTEYRIYKNGELKSVDFAYLRKKARPYFPKEKFTLRQLISGLMDKEAFADLPDMTVFSHFIQRLIAHGDLIDLGPRPQEFVEGDRWLCTPSAQ